MSNITEARVRKIVREELALLGAAADPNSEQWQALAVRAASLLERAEMLPGALKLRNQTLKYPDERVSGTQRGAGLHPSVSAPVSAIVESAGIVEEAAGLSDSVSHSSSPVRSVPEGRSSGNAMIARENPQGEAASPASPTIKEET